MTARKKDNDNDDRGSGGRGEKMTMVALGSTV